MMAAGTAHDRAREHSTVTRSDQAELRRDGRRTRHPIKKLVAVSKRTAAGRARTGDFEIFSLALSQTELPRRGGSERWEGEKGLREGMRTPRHRRVPGIAGRLSIHIDNSRGSAGPRHGLVLLGLEPSPGLVDRLPRVRLQGLHRLPPRLGILRGPDVV